MDSLIDLRVMAFVRNIRVSQYTIIGWARKGHGTISVACDAPISRICDRGGLEPRH